MIRNSYCLILIYGRKEKDRRRRNFIMLKEVEEDL